MSVQNKLLALAIALVWGLTFVSIKLALVTLPPFALSFWRFFLAAFPLLFFVGKPQAPWRWLAAYGILIAVLQFVVMFFAMNLGFPTGLMSLVVQMQVFFTIALSVLLFGERISRPQLVGSLIAASGLVVIGSTKTQGGALIGFMLVLFAAFAWASGNSVAKHIARTRAAQQLPAMSPMNFIAWSSLCSLPLLALISLSFEKSGALLVPITQFSWSLAFHLCVMAYAAQVFGYGLWANLLSKFSASAVSPFALFVPVAGMSATALAFGERLTQTQIVGACIVISGLAIAVLWTPKTQKYLRRK